VAGLSAVHSGHISIGSKNGRGHTIIYLDQQPKLFWLYVIIVFVAGVIFIFQAIRNRD
jgi:hypothetical protein